MFRPLTYASTFTGIGGFEIGLAESGMTPTVFSEIDNNASKVLAHHYKDVPQGGDIRGIHGSDLGRVDLVLGGFPCKDTSRGAPRRLGLAGERSGLFFEFRRLLDEHLRLLGDSAARWCVIENPDGLLRSNGGADMAAVVGGLEELGYGWAYRLVDSGGPLGSPQRRPRVIVVGHRGGDSRPAGEVLGLLGAGDEAPAARPVRRNTVGPQAVVDPAGADGQLIFRKKARARAAIDKGGWESWVAVDDHETGNTLTGFDGGGPLRQTHLVHQGGRLRALTLTEWERLSGVPDGWTDMIPNSARYEALGNIAHPVMTAWLGRNLTRVHNALPMLPERTLATA